MMDKDLSTSRRKWRERERVRERERCTNWMWMLNMISNKEKFLTKRERELCIFLCVSRLVQSVSLWRIPTHMKRDTEHHVKMYHISR